MYGKGCNVILNVSTIFCKEFTTLQAPKTQRIAENVHLIICVKLNNR